VQTAYRKKELNSASMISCDESQSDEECSEPDLSSFYMIGKKFINRGRWTKQEVKSANVLVIKTFSFEVVLGRNIFSVQNGMTKYIAFIPM